MKTLLFATTNKGKLAELLALTEGMNLKILSLNDVSPMEVIEDGAEFAQNAEKKALTYRDALGVAVLGDDTGLCVDALNGAPGVLSARYGGVPEGVLDEAIQRYRANNERLLRELQGVPAEQRSAHFETDICFAEPHHPPRHFTGRVDGFILESLKGDNGFGYDPLFFVKELGATLAEVPKATKNAISHRARAFQKLKPMLELWAKED